MVSFGLQIEPQFGFTYEQIRDLARLCESVGFNSLWCSDHLFLDAQSESRNCWDAWTALTGLAVETSTVRLGTLVTCVSYRYPSILAKMAACVDYMSGGRLEMGIGAGWKQVEYEAYGIPFPPARERVDRLEEALNVILAMWTEARPSYQGRYYQIRDALCAPRPVQQPRPPIWIGGSRPRVLDIASRYADWINISGFPDMETYRARLADFERACRRNNRDFASVRKSHFTGIAIAPDRGGVQRLMEDAGRQRGQTPEQARASYRGFVGTPEEVTAFLKQFVDLGVEQFMLVFPYGREADSVRLMAERVLPSF